MALRITAEPKSAKGILGHDTRKCPSRAATLAGTLAGVIRERGSAELQAIGAGALQAIAVLAPASVLLVWSFIQIDWYEPVRDGEEQ